MLGWTRRARPRAMPRAACVPVSTTLIGQAPSSNLRSNSSTTAARAASSSSPMARTVSAVPMPAASIITPMMLCAFTSRPLLMIHTVDLKLETSWTSLAEARACRPSRLDTTMSRSSMVDENPSATATGRDLGQFGQRFIRIIEYAQEHRQVQPRDAAQVHAQLAQGKTDIARRRAIKVGEDEHAVAMVEVAGMLGGERAHDVGVRAGRHFHGVHVHRQLGHDMARGRDQRFADRFVGHEEDADAHRPDSRCCLGWVMALFELTMKSQYVAAFRAEMLGQLLDEVDRAMTPARTADRNGDVAAILALEAW